MDSMKLTFSSKLRDITSCNGSFDIGKMLVAYHGKNRNKTDISKAAFENAVKTMYNVPVVANYIREDDVIGGHDIELVKKDDKYKLVNMTHPVGVVPESANYWWETVVEDDGNEHEYLGVDVLLWKRQEAYQTIKENGITAESMEIDIKSGHKDGGIYFIDDFQFTAFCLLGNVEPCFESASVSIYNADTFSLELNDMLSEVPSAMKNYAEEVSNKVMNEKLQLMEKFGLKITDLDFELSEFSLDELTAKFEAIKRVGVPEDGDDDGDETPTDPAGDQGDGDTGSADGPTSTDPAGNQDTTDDPSNTDPTNDPTDTDSGNGSTDEPADGQDGDGGGDPESGAGDENYSVPGTFALYGQELFRELNRLLSEVKTHYDWGECSRYWLVDVDAENHVIFCEDGANKCIYVRLNYSVSGDVITIDFDSQKRVKCVFVDFDDGTGNEVEPATEVFAQAVCSAYSSELNALREFKLGVEAEKRKADEEALFAQFSDITSYDEFTKLSDERAKFSLEELEEKCYAIRGRHQKMNFSFGQRKNAGVVLPVGSNPNVNQRVPYGGIVEKYK